MIDPENILIGVLSEHNDDNKWTDATFEHIKRISNTKVGEVGQDFIERLCYQLGFQCEFPINEKGRRATQNPWDIKIQDITFELKTATEDVKNSFQFNHIRYHREYQALLCLGITPNDILFNAWSKADVATGKAGRLVSMEKSANASYKLTKRPNELYSIDELKNVVTALLDEIR